MFFRVWGDLRESKFAFPFPPLLIFTLWGSSKEDKAKFQDLTNSECCVVENCLSQVVSVPNSNKHTNKKLGVKNNSVWTFLRQIPVDKSIFAD